MSDRLLAPAKINLCLDVMGQDQQAGKHFVNTFLYLDESFCDELELEQIGGDSNELFCAHPEVPSDESNTILKALHLLGIKGWMITLHKKIPVQAGLGGGSSNAAAVMKYFADMKRIPREHLEPLAAQVGADVPAFLAEGNLVYCEGYGDQIVQSWEIEPLKIQYEDSGIKVSTAEAYASLHKESCGLMTHKTESLLQRLNEGWRPDSFQDLSSYVHNDFELSFFEKNPSCKGKGNLCGSGGWMWRGRNKKTCSSSIRRGGSK